MNDTKQFLLSVIASFMHTPYERTYPGPMLCAPFAGPPGAQLPQLLQAGRDARRFM